MVYTLEYITRGLQNPHVDLNALSFGSGDGDGGESRHGRAVHQRTFTLAREAPFTFTIFERQRLNLLISS